MPEFCTDPTCCAYGSYCRIPGHMKDAPKKEVKPIPVRSAKQVKVVARLRKAYALFLAMPENKYCKIKIEGCTKIATTVNHTNGRGANVENQQDWEPSCESCNFQIETKHKEAQKAGHKKQRHNIKNLRSAKILKKQAS